MYIVEWYKQWKSARLSGNICPREIPKVSPKRQSDYLRDLMWEIFFKKTLKIFHCFSDFGIKIPKIVRPRVALGQ